MCIILSLSVSSVTTISQLSTITSVDYDWFMTISSGATAISTCIIISESHRSTKSQDNQFNHFGMSERKYIKNNKYINLLMIVIVMERELEDMVVSIKDSDMEDTEWIVNMDTESDT
jgi:hypothetical protein